MTGSCPPSVNAIYGRLNPHLGTRVVREWRERASWLWRAKIPADTKLRPPVSVTATPLHVDRRSPQDVAACAPAVKAAIDALTDLGIIPDDGPDHVAAVTLT